MAPVCVTATSSLARRFASPTGARSIMQAPYFAIVSRSSHSPPGAAPAIEVRASREPMAIGMIRLWNIAVSVRGRVDGRKQRVCEAGGGGFRSSLPP